MACVINKNNKLSGVFTDGDIRRALSKEVDIHTTSIKQVMTTKATTISDDELAINALTMMQNKKITSLIIIDETTAHPCGVIHMHDILNAGVI